MTIKDEFAGELKDAMRNRDKPRLNVIRQVQTEISVAAAAEGFSGEVDDDLYRRVIAGYVKKMDKARREYLAAGDKGAERAAALEFEVGLPLALAAAEARRGGGERARGGATIAELGASDAKQVGQVTGAVMRSGAEVDGSLVARLVREEFGA